MVSQPDAPSKVPRNRCRSLTYAESIVMGYRNRIYGGREASSGQMDGLDGRVQVGDGKSRRIK